MEEIKSVAFGRDVEFVIVAEEVSVTAAGTGREKARAGGGGFLEDGFKDLDIGFSARG